jgi:nucleotide-binding universal stress UspA family protein
MFMAEVKKILIPVNFSEDSADGLKYAASLAKETQAELIVLHVAQKKEAETFLDFLAVMEGLPALNRPVGIPLDRLLREKALDLYRFIEEVVRNPGRLKISRKVVLGNKVEKIVEIVNAEKIDLVVLADGRKPFFARLMARGKLLKMLSRLPCPVLLKIPFADPWRHSGIIRRSAFAR